MERLLTPSDVAGILRVGKRTAYSYMAEMHHLQNPLRVTEAALREWMDRKAVKPKGTKTRHKFVTEWHIERR